MLEAARQCAFDNTGLPEERRRAVVSPVLVSLLHEAAERRWLCNARMNTIQATVDRGRSCVRPHREREQARSCDAATMLARSRSLCDGPPRGKRATPVRPGG